MPDRTHPVYARKVPASLEGHILGVIQGILDAHDQGKLPKFAYDESEGTMEVCFLPITHPRPTGELPFTIVEDDAIPIAADAVCDVEDGA